MGIVALETGAMAGRVCHAVKDYPLKRVEFFGPYAKNPQTEEGDIGLLVESTAAVPLLMIADLKLRLERGPGVEVDVTRAPLPAGSLVEADGAVPLCEVWEPSPCRKGFRGSGVALCFFAVKPLLA